MTWSFGLNEPTKAKAKTRFKELARGTPGGPTQKVAAAVSATIDAFGKVPKDGSVSVSASGHEDPRGGQTLNLTLWLQSPPVV